MANEVMIPPEMQRQLPASFQGEVVDDDLGAGIGQSFGIITYRGKVWGVKFQGTEVKLMRDDGDGPRNSIEVVIVKAANAIAKMWYENGYVEGSNSPPDCWSANGMTPEPAAPKKQCQTCAACPKNVFGSRVTEAGKNGKECTDMKRLAVVPMNDIDNETYNGPMLLRVPAASLKELVAYSNQLKQYNFGYYMVATRISFDPEAAHPKFKMGAIRVLTEEEAVKVKVLRDNDPRVKRMLEGTVEAATHEPVKDEEKPSLNAVFEQPPQDKAAVEQAVTKAAATAPSPQPQPQPQPAVQPKVTPKPAEPARRLGEGTLPDGTEVEYDLDTGEIVRELKAAPKVTPKPAITPKAAPAATAAPAEFNDMLDSLLES